MTDWYEWFSISKPASVVISWMLVPEPDQDLDLIPFAEYAEIGFALQGDQAAVGFASLEHQSLDSLF